MRIENVVIAVASETVPGFIEFEPVTLVPIQVYHYRTLFFKFMPI